MIKHGFEVFEFRILEWIEDERVSEPEMYWVSYYDSFNPEKGYNLTLGGEYRADVQIRRDQEESPLDLVIRRLRIYVRNPPHIMRHA
jgi:hypothetical protein